jgi:murein DD-endopeptidase MepM/ murein hydrolase activator NlpD
MAGPIVLKSSLPNTVSGPGQSPTGVTDPASVVPRSFQEMLTRAVAHSNGPVAEPPGNTGESQADNQGATTSEYTIRAGETLSGVVAAVMREQGGGFSSSALYNAVNRVAADNGLANPDRIFPGQKIRLTGLGKPGMTAEPAPGQSSGGAVLSPAASQSDTGTLQPPAFGRLSSRFGMRIHPVFGKEQHHDGIDISVPVGTPIQPVDSGTVTFAGEKGGYGLLVEIDHGNGLTSRYAHLSELLVRVGEEVASGRPLGLAGQTGLATGPHLHLEIRRDQQPINPLLLLSRKRIETDGGRGIV